ncbi:MAG: translation initiation factor IF-2 [Acidobacteria bacterium]|nr:translation initiation factor IF-2 [Acidobacteriota bacterium]
MIRINELARELEVKPKAILDLLPDLGVSEIKTHSSSIEADVAVVVKQKLLAEAAAQGPKKNRGGKSQQEDEPVGHDDHSSDHGDHAEPAQQMSLLETAPIAAAPATVAPETAKPAIKEAPPKPAPAPAAETPAPASSAPVAHAPVAPVEPQKPQPLAPPLRSPLMPPLAASAGNKGAPSMPIRPVLATPTPVAPPVLAATPTIAPVAPAPAIPAPAPAPPVPGPAAPAPSSPMKQVPSMQVAPGPAVPAAPRPPAPRPGTVVPSPMPAAQIAPGTPLRTAPAAPQAPRPPQNIPLAPRPGQVIPAQRSTAAPGAPSAPPAATVGAPGMPMPRPQANQPLAGNRAGVTPGAPSMPRPPQQSRPPLQGSGQSFGPPKPQTSRPIVPPDPKLAERIAQSQARQQQPAVGTRPGAPLRPPGPAMPGRPQPPRAMPGAAAPRGPGGYGGGGGGYTPGGGYNAGRPPLRTGKHPTSPTPLRPEASVLPSTEPGRRHAVKPTKSKEQIRREKELEQEGKLLFAQRKREEEVSMAANKEITISEGITVKELSEKLGIRTNLVIKKLVEKKIFATINQPLDVKMAEELAANFGATATQMSFEEESTWDIEMAEDNGVLVRRAPVVTVMGHVDHGKTSLLDAIRSANVASGEAGGITQHIGAYAVTHNSRKIVFIDTPGHEAFTRMRARGSKVTDIVILCVAADDGVMPQTIEAIDHAKAAGVPIIVAINKIDKPDAQIDRIKQQLNDRGLLAEDWGGDTVMVPVSAKQRLNIDLLLEMILLMADVNEAKLRANPSRPALATVLEAQLDKGRGSVATVLVRNGTLRVGDFFICGSVFGKVRALFDDLGRPVKEAEPATPVEVLGLEQMPEVGDTFQVVTDTSKAKQIVLYREAKARDIAMARTRISLDALHQQLKEGEIKDLNLILKSDVGGSAEVLAETLLKLSNEKVRVRVLHTGVGAITETDVLLASASNAIIIGFNVRPDRSATQTADAEKVDIRLHTIIYEVVDQIKKAMAGMLDPVYKEVFRGRAEVRDVFRITKVGTVAGCYITEGTFSRDCSVRLLRDGEVVHTGKLDTLKRFKNDVSEVKTGFECGIAIANYQDIRPGDQMEAFVNERVAVEALMD